MLYGAEINPCAAGIANHVAKVKTANIEDKNLDFGDVKLDYIMFQRCGYTVKKIDSVVSTLSLPIEDARFIQALTSLSDKTNMAMYCIFQYIVSAMPNNEILDESRGGELMSKLPENNGDMSADINEQKIQEIEQVCSEKSAVWLSCERDYEQKINHYLQTRDRVRLLDILEDKDFYFKFNTHTYMAYMILAGQIYHAELEDGVSHTIFDERGSIKEVEAHIRKLKFLLWHLEFQTSDSAGEELLIFIQQEQVSVALLKYMVHTVGMDKIYLLESLADLFLEQDLLGASFAVLKYADEILPGQEDILCSMADLCIKAGKKEEAVQCLDKIDCPGRITQVFRKLCET